MDKIPLISLILYSFPESLVFISISTALYGYHVKENYKKILLYGLVHTIAAYFVRSLPLPFGAVIAMQIITYIFLIVLILRLSLLRAVFIVLTGYIIFLLEDSIVLPFLLKSFSISLDQVVKDPVLRVAIGWMYLLPLSLLTYFIIRKKLSFVTALNLIKPKTSSGKIILWLVLLILLQALIGLTIYLVFYNKLYYWSATGTAIFQSAWFSNLLGFLLVIIPTVSIFMIIKLFKLTEKENIIASQEVFIENVNDLFNTIRAERHDFLNNIQVLNSYINMNLIEAVKVYMANFIQESTEFDEILVVNNPVLNTLILTKIAIAQQYKINFELDIQSSLTDLNIKPFDLVKITGNLINNAIEAVKDLDRKKRKVKFTINKQNNIYMIEVFYPAKTGLEHRGAGLAAVKNLTEKYKGTVTVQSSEAAGTTLMLRCLQIRSGIAFV